MSQGFTETIKGVVLPVIVESALELVPACIENSTHTAISFASIKAIEWRQFERSHKNSALAHKHRRKVFEHAFKMKLLMALSERFPRGRSAFGISHLKMAELQTLEFIIRCTKDHRRILKEACSRCLFLCISFTCFDAVLSIMHTNWNAHYARHWLDTTTLRGFELVK